MAAGLDAAAACAGCTGKTTGSRAAISGDRVQECPCSTAASSTLARAVQREPA
jgi:hypothetical protein